MIIDVYEPKNIEYELKQLGIKMERRKMKSGDYIFADIGIERKTVNDFLGSVYKGRLFNQVYNLSQTYDRPILWLIGEIPPTQTWIRIRKRRLPIALTDEQKEKRMNTIYKTINTIYNSNKVPTFYSMSEKRFILQLSDLYFKTIGTELKLKPVKPKRYSIPEIKSDMITCIPGFGRKKGDILADKFTIKELCGMKSKTLKKIKGLGDKRIKMLKDVLTK